MAFLLPLGCFADDLIGNYNMSYLNMMTGIPNNYVDDIYEDSYGFVWISTNGNGLARYDGYGYTYFGIGAPGVSLKSNSCRNVCEDNSHRLWIAFEECIDVIDLHTMKSCVPKAVSSFLDDRLKKIMQEECVRVYKDARDHLWIATRDNVHCVYFNTAGMITDIKSVSYLGGFPDVAIRDVFGDGTVMIGSGGRIHKLIPNGRIVEDVDLSGYYKQLTGRFITDIINYRGKIWIGTNGGLFCSDGSSFHYKNGKKGELVHEFVTSLCESPSGSLLVGTLGGISVFNPDTRSITSWSMTSRVNPLSSNFINCIYSSNGHIWIGSDTGGAMKLSPRRLKVENYSHNSDQSSLAPNAVNAMYVENNGTLWVGNVEGGLSRKAKGEKSFTHYIAESSGLIHNSVSVLAEDGKSRLWIGTWGGGVCYMDLNNPGAFHRLPVQGGNAEHLVFIGTLCYDPINKGMWIGANDGLFFYNFRKEKLEEPFDGCRNIRGCIGSIVTHDGTLSVGCFEGMVQVYLKSGLSGKGKFLWRQLRNKLDKPNSGIHEKITSFYQSKDGTLWLGSNGYGLYRLDYDSAGKEHFKCFTQNDGLVSNMVKGIVEDDKGMMWITTCHGLSLLNPRTGVFTNFSESDGLISSDFYWNSAVRSVDGTIYLGSEKGLTVLYGLNGEYLYGGNLRFTRLLVDNEEVFAGSDYIDRDVSVADKISLHESNRSFTVEFSALNYGGKSDGVYSYRMKGYEDDWIILKPGQHSVRYSMLPAGSYEFEVRYSPDMNSRNDKFLSIKVDVTPFFWKSWWFLMLTLALFVVFGRWLYCRRIKAIRDREAELLYKPLEAALKESEEPEKLQLRIKTILSSHQIVVSSQKKSVEAERRYATHRERPFMEEITAIMEANYSNSDFGVSQLCEMMNLNRATLARHLVSETGYAASQFMRHYRLEVARRMLADESNNFNITEIAYKVGFNDPKYFTRCFTKEFGVAPSSFKG